MAECQFCMLSIDGRSRHFADVMHSSDFDELLHIEAELLLIPDIAPCSIGHMLLVSRSHRVAFTGIWKASTHTRIISTIESCLPNDQRLLIYEHGIVSEDAKPSCVEHAHAHLIPATRSIRLDLVQELGQLEEISGPEAVDTTAIAEYAILRDIDGQWYQALARQIPGQSIRRAILGSGPYTHWNWLDYVEFSGPLATRRLVLAGAPIFERIRCALAELE